MFVTRLAPIGNVGYKRVCTHEARMKRTKAYQPDLIKSLRDAREAKNYLNAALEEDDPELFLLALRNVAEAQGGVAQLAEKPSSIAKALQNAFRAW